MNQALEDIRRDIDAVDDDIAVLLAKRHKLVQAVLEVKRREGIAARLPDRIAAVIDRSTRNAAAAGANPDLARHVWTAMVEWFVQHEELELARRATATDSFGTDQDRR